MKKYLAILCIVAIGMAVSCGGDSSEDMKVDCATSSLAVSVTSTTDAACNAQGSIQVSATGGSGTVQFSINGTTFQSSGTFSVSAGTYTVTARDKNNCTATVQATVNAVGDAITIHSVVATDSGCGTSNASITVTASGGDGTPLTYKLGNGSFQSSNVFNNVAAGSHTITVTDGACTAPRTQQVRTGTSLVSDIMPLLESKCAISGCHNGDNGAARNWTVKANVLANASNIKSMTQSGAMPQTGSITQAEKDIIACWVDDGALDN